MTLEHFDDKYEVMKFDCTPFSAFPDERETLFFGPNRVLQITELRQRTISRMKVYDKWLEPIDKVYCEVSWELYEQMKSIESSLKRMNAVLMSPICTAKSDSRSATASMPQYIRDLISFQNQTIYDEVESIHEDLQDMLCERFPGEIVMRNESLWLYRSEEVTQCRTVNRLSYCYMYCFFISVEFRQMSR